MTFFTFAQYERLISFFASVLYDPLVQDSQWDSLACTTRSGRVWVKGQRLCLSDHRLAAKWAWSQTQPQNTPHSSHASQFYGGQHMHIIYAHLSNQAFSPGTCTINRLLGLLSPDPKKKRPLCAARASGCISNKGFEWHSSGGEHLFVLDSFAEAAFKKKQQISTAQAFSF